MLSVGKRLLWVGEAAYPLHNVTRVHTFVLRPRRAEAVLDFLKWGGIAVVAFAALRGMGNDSTSGLEIVPFAVVVVFFARMMQVLTASDEHVLAVETASASTAVVTLADAGRLRQLVDDIVHAIEHPDAELQVLVQSVHVNPKNYHFGDEVNMYGGLGNLGLVKK
ncbi:DUF6232 family protein [Streptomyces sp. NK08204]|uniref:DUF6232 family protein n=1 Tax=Streptomyces sp. NK08204 TaxID=2873260 RepID=UPI001CEC0513|nr:DUF6232 family protein [Streptomyces sp. NK08204]